jgi:hypothetical protein
MISRRTYRIAMVAQELFRTDNKDFIWKIKD